MRAPSLFGPLLVALAIAPLAGCDHTDEAASCGALPEADACPLARGGTCDDRSCAAVYSCRDGAWALVDRCQRGDQDGGAGAAGAAGAAGSNGQGGAGDGGACQPTPGPPSLCPSLLPPECDARIIDGCDEGACDTGCEVFLRCENGDWAASYAGYCVDGGLIRP